eukprot:359913-Chlamydomonas_euryale.AAC.13
MVRRRGPLPSTAGCKCSGGPGAMPDDASKHVAIHTSTVDRDACSAPNVANGGPLDDGGCLEQIVFDGEQVAAGSVFADIGSRALWDGGGSECGQVAFTLDCIGNERFALHVRRTSGACGTSRGCLRLGAPPASGAPQHGAGDAHSSNAIGHGLSAAWYPCSDSGCCSCCRPSSPSDASASSGPHAGGRSSSGGGSECASGGDEHDLRDGCVVHWSGRLHSDVEWRSDGTALFVVDGHRRVLCIDAPCPGSREKSGSMAAAAVHVVYDVGGSGGGNGGGGGGGSESSGRSGADSGSGSSGGDVELSLSKTRDGRFIKLQVCAGLQRADWVVVVGRRGCIGRTEGWAS